MKTYEFTVGIGFVGAEHTDYFEFDDDITEDEIEEAWQEWAYGFVDGAYKQVDENPYDE